MSRTALQPASHLNLWHCISERDEYLQAHSFCQLSNLEHAQPSSWFSLLYVVWPRQKKPRVLPHQIVSSNLVKTVEKCLNPVSGGITSLHMCVWLCWVTDFLVCTVWSDWKHRHTDWGSASPLNYNSRQWKMYSALHTSKNRFHQHV